MLSFQYPGPESVSLHNHSNMSDGTASPEEMCLAAKKAGVRTFGLSDHWVVHPQNIPEQDAWRMPPEKLESYVEILLSLKKHYDSENFTVRLGLEVDFFFENIEDVISNLRKYPFDYLIGSVHYAGTFPIDNDEADWLPLNEEQKAAVCGEYWKKLTGAAECGYFTFLGHLDLPKKYMFIQNEHYFPEAFKVLEAARKTNTAIELNTSGFFKKCHEQYPARPILREAKRLQIPIIINSDAHAVQAITAKFDEAHLLLENC